MGILLEAIFSDSYSIARVDGLKVTKPSSVTSNLSLLAFHYEKKNFLVQ
tara:strand:+ start:3571 stop:3717 length:147 start_codon:yes stop_codon:yes gene_type:complete